VRDAGLAAESGKDVVVEVVLADELAAVAEQVGSLLPGLAFDQVGLGRPDEFPGVDELADYRVDRLVERPGSLVLRDVQQTDGEGITGGVVGALVPGDAVQFESADLVDAAAAEQPDADHRADHLDGVVGGLPAGFAGPAGAVGLEVLGVQGQPGGHELGP
jgi:hypothetical protein